MKIYKNKKLSQQSFFEFMVLAVLKRTWKIINNDGKISCWYGKPNGGNKAKPQKPKFASKCFGKFSFKTRRSKIFLKYLMLKWKKYKYM